MVGFEIDSNHANRQGLTFLALAWAGSKSQFNGPDPSLLVFGLEELCDKKKEIILILILWMMSY